VRLIRVAVATMNMSTAAVAVIWFCTKLRQVGKGALRRIGAAHPTDQGPDFGARRGSVQAEVGRLSSLGPGLRRVPVLSTVIRARLTGTEHLTDLGEEGLWRTFLFSRSGVISRVAHNLFCHRSVCDATFLFIAKNRKVRRAWKNPSRSRGSLCSVLGDLCEDHGCEAFGQWPG
jgi:hypothetical protein